MTDLQKQQITQMRVQGKKYAEISDSLGIALGTIKAFCSRKLPKTADIPDPVIPIQITEGNCKRCGRPLQHIRASAKNFLLPFVSAKILAGA